jgi:DNA polymerase elongation subunit (family B)
VKRLPVPRLRERRTPAVAAPLLDVSYDKLYFAGGIEMPLKEVHDPYFLVIAKPGDNVRRMAGRIPGLFPEGRDNPVLHMGGVTRMKSYANPGEFVDAVPVYLKHPGLTEQASHRVFFSGAGYTLSHDVPYRQRVLADLGAEGVCWPMDTKGELATLKVVCYDLEATQYHKLSKQGRGAQAPIDMAGWATFTITYTSRVNLDLENQPPPDPSDVEAISQRTGFRVVSLAADWREVPIHQRVATTETDEARMLAELARALMEADVVSGHNILGYDNRKMASRIQFLLGRRNALADVPDADWQALHRISERMREDQHFNQGKSEQVTILQPTSFDTLALSRLLYRNTDSHTLKDMAKLLGVIIPDRQYLTHEELDVNDARTQKYHQDDVREQLGVTIKLLPQAINQAVLTGLPFDKAFDTATTFLWDHMCLIRAAHQGKTFPTMYKPLRVGESVLRLGGGNRHKLAEQVMAMGEQGSSGVGKDTIRLLKQGTEAPSWIDWADGIFQLGKPEPKAESEDDEEEDEGPQEAIGCHQVMQFIGGLAVKPQDPDVNSTWIPWYDVVTADVGAMYPSIFKAKNCNGDTVRLARPGETPTDYVEFREIGEGLKRIASKMDGLWRVPVVVLEEPGLANCAMGGILASTRLAKHLWVTEAAKPDHDKVLVKALNDQYASVKPMRNSGTHGILSSAKTSSRQFAPLPGGLIPAIGQHIIQDILATLRKLFRVVYADTDGVYLPTQRTIAFHEKISKAIGIAHDPVGLPTCDKKLVISTIEALSKRWQRRLNYADFTLEAEETPCMVFQAHKNYILLDFKNGKVDLKVKGNNFKGKDKAPVVLNTLKKTIESAILDVHMWSSEDEARNRLREALVHHAKRNTDDLDLNAIDVKELTIRTIIKDAGVYAKLGKNKDKEAPRARASRALASLLGQAMDGTVRYGLVVCKNGLPSIQEPKKTGDKPLDFMWPVESVKREDLDMEWYRAMVTRYVKARLEIIEPKPVKVPKADAVPKGKQLSLASLSGWGLLAEAEPTSAGAAPE